MICSISAIFGGLLKGILSMKTAMCAGVAALMIAFGPMVFAAEKLTEADASGGKSSGQWVLFLSKGQAPGAPTGTCAVAVGNGDTIEAAYGMNIKAGKPVVSAIAADAIKADRASDKEPMATTLVVKVTGAQHDDVKKLLEKWTAIEKHEDSVMDVSVNFVQEVVDALGMKRSYRSGLGGLNPVQYYADLAINNRKLGQKATP